MEKIYPNLSRLLLERMHMNKDCTMVSSGLVYRVDIFKQDGLPVIAGIPVKQQWRINEIELVPNAHTFITLYHAHSTTLSKMGVGFNNYIRDNYTPHYPV